MLGMPGFTRNVVLAIPGDGTVFFKARLHGLSRALGGRGGCRQPPTRLISTPICPPPPICKANTMLACQVLKGFMWFLQQFLAITAKDSWLLQQFPVMARCSLKHACTALKNWGIAGLWGRPPSPFANTMLVYQVWVVSFFLSRYCWCFLFCIYLYLSFLVFLFMSFVISFAVVLSLFVFIYRSLVVHVFSYWFIFVPPPPPPPAGSLVLASLIVFPFRYVVLSLLLSFVLYVCRYVVRALCLCYLFGCVCGDLFNIVCCLCRSVFFLDLSLSFCICLGIS